MGWWCAGAVPFRVCEDAKQQQVAQGGRTEVQLVYNENRREYFSVHLFYVRPDGRLFYHFLFFSQLLLLLLLE